MNAETQNFDESIIGTDHGAVTDGAVNPPDDTSGEDTSGLSAEDENVVPGETEDVISRRIDDIDRRWQSEIARRDAELKLAEKLTADWEGDTFEEKLISKQAYEQNVPPDVIRRQRLEERLFVENQVANHPLILEARSLKLGQMAGDDFNAIKQAFPDVSAGNMDELIKSMGGSIDENRFLELRLKNGIDAVTAYHVAITERARKEKPLPPNAGNLKSSALHEKEFFSDDEISSFSAEELAENDKLFEKVKKSLFRNNKK